MTNPQLRTQELSGPDLEGVRVHAFDVVPAVPEPLARLRELSYNLWWIWNPEAVDLFRRLDLKLWRAVGHNPVRLLSVIEPQLLADAAKDEAFLSHQADVLEQFDQAMSKPGWYEQNCGSAPKSTIAYFSPEFGLHESLPVYSGGLGVLAGDHLKSASDLGLPMVGVGLFYRQGYFHQHLSIDGWQMEEYPALDLGQLPIQLVYSDDGSPTLATVRIGQRDVSAQIWRVRVGRIQLFLLDSDIEANHADDRAITARLYGGGEEMRIRQEVLLGIGGLRALYAMGIEPTVCHLNEGHSAFLALERIRRLCERDGLSFTEAIEAVRAGTVFTTHTPVPAGIDRFPPGLVDAWLGEYIKSMPVDLATVRGLGQANPADANCSFSMAILALRSSGRTNGVSKMHGDVSRSMWGRLWPGLPHDEVPIRSITNGIHVSSWVAPEMSGLFDRYLGPHWNNGQDDPKVWDNVRNIPDAELWRTHVRLREQLVVSAREHLKKQRERRGAPPADIADAERTFNPEALTIGFARRFAQYKRATLFLQDPDRIAKLLCSPDRPVQFLIAGKAHPRDDGGKHLIQRISHFARGANVQHRVVFLEDYDIRIARRMVQGVDVWLNNPIKGHEASGTSGMKVGPNGGLNLSVLDGWWPEAYDGTNGWAIGDERIYDDAEYQRRVEAEALYKLLEQELVPMFFDRGSDGVPHRWIERMKSSIRTVTSKFNTHRMVREYTTEMYVPSAKRWNALRSEKFAAGKSLADWRSRVAAAWPNVRVEEVDFDRRQEYAVNQEIDVTARVQLGGLSPDDVEVQAYTGTLDGDGSIQGSESFVLSPAGDAGNGAQSFHGRIRCARAGRQAFAVRVLGRNDHGAERVEPGFLRWE